MRWSEGDGFRFVEFLKGADHGSGGFRPRRRPCPSLSLCFRRCLPCALPCCFTHSFPNMPTPPWGRPTSSPLARNILPSLTVWLTPFYSLSGVLSCSHQLQPPLYPRIPFPVQLRAPQCGGAPSTVPAQWPKGGRHPCLGDGRTSMCPE